MIEDRRKGGIKPMLCCASVQTNRGKVAIFSDGAFLTVLAWISRWQEQRQQRLRLTITFLGHNYWHNRPAGAANRQRLVNWS